MHETGAVDKVETAEHVVKNDGDVLLVEIFVFLVQFQHHLLEIEINVFHHQKYVVDRRIILVDFFRNYDII